MCLTVAKLNKGSTSLHHNLMKEVIPNSDDGLYRTRGAIAHKMHVLQFLQYNRSTLNIKNDKGK